MSEERVVIVVIVWITWQLLAQPPAAPPPRVMVGDLRGELPVIVVKADETLAPPFRDISDFLAEQAARAFSAAELSGFLVRLYAELDGAAVQVYRGDLLLAQRKLTSRDVAVAKATAWMLVRSTIERALSSPVETPTVDVALPAAELATLDASRPGGETTPVSEPTAEASSAAPSPDVIPPPRVELERPVLSAPRLRPSGFGATVLAQAWLDAPNLVAFGGSVAGRWQNASYGLGVEAGYMYAPGVGELSMHSVPVGILAGLALGRVAEVGLKVDAVIGVAESDGLSRSTVGVLGGPYGQLRLSDDDGAAPLVRLSAAVRFLRHRFLVREAIIDEPVFTLALSTGLGLP